MPQNQQEAEQKKPDATPLARLACFKGAVTVMVAIPYLSFVKTMTIGFCRSARWLGSI
jgi:hypothetical protein